MKLFTRSPRTVPDPGVHGVARLDRRTDALTTRLQPGDVAVIDHVDLDRGSAEALVACRVGAVVNAAQSISGRYPNRGPEVLAAAGVPLLDAAGAAVFTRLEDGKAVRVHEGAVHRGGTVVATGEVLDAPAVRAQMAAAREGLAAQTQALTASAMELVRRDADLFLDGAGVPRLATRLEDRDVVVVATGDGAAEDLRTLRRYVSERRPVLIGVDAGADTLLAAGHRPDVVVGDVDRVSDAALRCGAEIVAHVDRDRRDTGQRRLERLEVSPTVFAAPGTGEDAALLIADVGGASVVVTVGTRASLVDYLDSGRTGLASTFLVRLRLGPRLVDAKAAARLHRSPVRSWQLLLMLVAGLLAVAVAIAATPVGGDWLDSVSAAVVDLYRRIQETVS